MPCAILAVSDSQSVPVHATIERQAQTIKPGAVCAWVGIAACDRGRGGCQPEAASVVSVKLLCVSILHWCCVDADYLSRPLDLLSDARVCFGIFKKLIHPGERQAGDGVGGPLVDGDAA